MTEATNVASQLESVGVPAGAESLVLRVIRRLVDGPVARELVDVQDLRVWINLGQLGAEYDELGRIVGLGGLTVRKTRHRLRIDNRDLFTWCALDTLFLPRLLGKTAEVESHCPVTGQAIRLRVSTERVETVSPPGVVVSLVSVDGCSNENRCDDGTTETASRRSLFGARGSFCSRVHFFSSRAVAQHWLSDHPEAVVVSLEEAFKIGRESCSDPLLAGGEAR